MSRVAVIPFPDIKGAYICLSGRKRPTRLVGERFYGEPEHAEFVEKFGDRGFRTEPCITFLANVGTVCAEWDGDHGPIQLTFQVPEGFKAPDDSWGGEAAPHWFFPFAIWAGHWSQMAVEENRLPQMFNAGDFAGIFAVLGDWADRRNEYWDGSASNAITAAEAPNA